MSICIILMTTVYFPNKLNKLTQIFFKRSQTSSEDHQGAHILSWSDHEPFGKSCSLVFEYVTHPRCWSYNKRNPNTTKLPVVHQSDLFWSPPTRALVIFEKVLLSSYAWLWEQFVISECNKNFWMIYKYSHLLWVHALTNHLNYYYCVPVL